MKEYDLFNDSQDEFASPDQREEMRELGINPDKRRKVHPIFCMDFGTESTWGSDDEPGL